MSNHNKQIISMVVVLIVGLGGFVLVPLLGQNVRLVYLCGEFFGALASLVGIEIRMRLDSLNESH